MKYVYAGNRDIGVWVLRYLMDQGLQPEYLLLTDEDSKERQEMIAISGLPSEKIVFGKPKLEELVPVLEAAQLDYIIGIHYPYIIRKALLEASKHGFLNLHPAYLPFNRGWHTPSWGILEGTPVGGTLHFMSEELDMGAIVHRKETKVAPSDTANSLYAKLKQTEFEVFKEALPKLIDFSYDTLPQNADEGTSRKMKELFQEDVSKIQLDKEYKAEDLIDTLRGLTTNSISEAAYFEKDGEKYRIQVQIEKDNG